MVGCESDPKDVSLLVQGALGPRIKSDIANACPSFDYIIIRRCWTLRPRLVPKLCILDYFPWAFTLHLPDFAVCAGFGAVVGLEKPFVKCEFTVCLDNFCFLLEMCYKQDMQ